MRDAMIAVGVIGAFVGAFWLAGLWEWALLWGLVAVAVAVAELISKLKTGRSVSQRFWAFRKEHPILGWSLIVLMVLAWVGLVVHLLWK